MYSIGFTGKTEEIYMILITYALVFHHTCNIEFKSGWEHYLNIEMFSVNYNYSSIA
jgi:hypothetical protein